MHASLASIVRSLSSLLAMSAIDLSIIIVDTGNSIGSAARLKHSANRTAARDEYPVQSVSLWDPPLRLHACHGGLQSRHQRSLGRPLNDRGPFLWKTLHRLLQRYADHVRELRRQPWVFEDVFGTPEHIHVFP